MNDRYLIHSGVKGQKWGVRRYQNPDGSLTAEGKAHYSKADKKLIKEANRDAKRHMDAKMYYGEGAGTRRKLLKNELAPKMKNDLYRETFEYRLENLDPSKSVNRAKMERKTRDGAKVAKKVVKASAAVLVTAVGLYATVPPVREAVDKVFGR